MKNFRLPFCCFFFLVAAAVAGENRLTNGSFEESLPLKKQRYRMELVKDWNLLLNGGADKCDIRLSKPGYEGRQALWLVTLGKTGFNSAVYGKDFPVRPGDEVTASVMMKGKGTGHIRIYYLDARGKRLKKYRMGGKPATGRWTPLVLKFSIPDGVSKIRYALETLRNHAAVEFDAACLEIAPGAELENAFLRIKLNPRLGGGVDSFYLKSAGFDFTTPGTFRKSGGMMNSIIPAARMPGMVRNLAFDWQVVRPRHAVRCSARLDSGPLAGLEVVKEYILNGKQPELTVKITLTNRGEKKFDVSQRIQNFVDSSPGIYSWPTPDWLLTFRQSGEPLNGMNSVVQDLFRAGWQARYYEKLNATLLFTFDVRSVRRIYDYLNQAPRFSTMEWYYRDLKLAPGDSWTTTAAIRVLEKQTGYYADPHGKTQKTETIKLFKMPEIPQQTRLPEQFDGYFPYGANLGNLNQPEMAGSTVSQSYSKQFCRISRRLTRILVDAYINTLTPGRMIYGNIHRAFRGPDGRHRLGELLDEYDLKFILSTLFSHREDIEVSRYMTSKWPRMQKLMTDPDLQKFIAEYQKRIPAVFTGDELKAKNVDVILRVRRELGKLLPKHIVAFPYLNSSAVELLPYLPVFVGDWYPIKRALASGRNPWNVYPEFSALVKRAGETPVWFMPQGFARNGRRPDTIYALPTAGELRLMLHLAAAAGVRGIIWHGFPNGSWPWMMNYQMYPYSLLGGAGQRSPSWPGVVDAGRAFATVGPLLTSAHPVAPPAGVSVSCGQYKSSNGFYDGPAIRLFSLKLKRGSLLLAVNQNPEAVERGVLSLPEGKVFDLSGLTPVVKKRYPITLAPGDGLYLYRGPDFKELDPAFRSRFRAEAARYRLLADRAAPDGIRVLNPDTLTGQPPLDALRLLLKERGELEKRIAAAPLGKTEKELNEIRNLLERIDFRLCCALELVVTPEMRKATRRYARWVSHPDPKFNAIRNRLVRVFADYYRLSDRLDDGSGSAAVAGEVSALVKQVKSVVADADAYLDSHPNRAVIDNPYAE